MKCDFICVRLWNVLKKFSKNLQKICFCAAKILAMKTIDFPFDEKNAVIKHFMYVLFEF